MACAVRVIIVTVCVRFLSVSLFTLHGPQVIQWYDQYFSLMKDLGLFYYIVYWRSLSSFSITPNLDADKDVLLKIIQAANLLELEPKLTVNLALVLLHDYFFGKGIQCGGPMKYCIFRHKEGLNASFNSLEYKNSKKSVSIISRYARVNLLKSDVPSVITALQKDGYSICDHECRRFKKNNFSIDPILPDVLKFHPLAPLSSHPLHLSLNIILQDKASCLAAYLLAPPPGSRVLDCCAAPGNKTTHLASIMRNKGSIVAFDKDPMRFAVLKARLKAAGVTCATPILSDILNAKPEDYRKTEYILVDPSCSGSGMLHRQDYEEEDVSHRRLRNLARFQVKVLKHALKFPSVKRVLYSTCSIHEVENEMVVNQALQKFQHLYELEEILPQWSCRGYSSFAGGEKCLRSGPISGTNGFFIALFVRKSAVSQNSKQGKSKSKRRRKRILPITK